MRADALADAGERDQETPAHFKKPREMTWKEWRIQLKKVGKQKKSKGNSKGKPEKNDTWLLARDRSESC